MPLSNFTRPGIPYDNAPLPNDNRFNIITRVLKKPITYAQLDGEFNKLTDNDNILDKKIEDVQAGILTGSDNPLNALKLPTTDGQPNPTLSWVKVNDDYIDEISGTKIRQLSIGTDQLDDGIVTPDKIPDDSIPYSKMDFNEGDIPYAIINTPDNTIPGSKLVAKSITQAKLGLLSVGTPELIDASVTLAKLANDIRGIFNSLMPISTIIELSGNSAPASIPNVIEWREANGQAVSRVTYAGLFSQIGALYGNGDGSTTFNLPDKRGRTAVGIGSDSSTGGRITNATTNNIVLGGTFGSETHTLALNEMPAHTHSYFRGSYGNISVAESVLVQLGTSEFQTTTGSTGSGAPHRNTQPSLFVRFYIRVL